MRVRALITSGVPTAGAVRAVTAVAAAAHEVPGPGVPDDATALAAAVGALDARRATQAARAIIEACGPAQAWTGTLAPYLRALGRTWQRTAAGIEREHLATRVIATQLDNYTAESAGRRRAPAVILAATRDEHHVLPLHALAAALAAREIDTCLLGTVPPPSVAAAATGLGAHIVVLWTLLRRPDDLEQLRQIQAVTPLVCAAGPGWRRRALPPPAAYVDQLTDALDLLQAWTG
jgi:hypothetical protein